MWVYWRQQRGGYSCYLNNLSIYPSYIESLCTSWRNRLFICVQYCRDKREYYPVTIHFNLTCLRCSPGYLDCIRSVQYNKALVLVCPLYKFKGPNVPGQYGKQSVQCKKFDVLEWYIYLSILWANSCQTPGFFFLFSNVQ